MRLVSTDIVTLRNYVGRIFENEFCEAVLDFAQLKKLLKQLMTFAQQSS